MKDFKAVSILIVLDDALLPNLIMATVIVNNDVSILIVLDDALLRLWQVR